MYAPKDGSKTKETVSSGGEKKEPPSSRTSTLTSTSSSAAGPKAMVCAADFKPEKVVLLLIVPVRIIFKKRKRNTFGLDTCSQVTMLCEAARAFLGLTGSEEDDRIGSWHNQDPFFRTQRIEFEVSLRDGSFKSVLSEVYSVQPSVLPYKKIAKMWPHLANIPMEGTISVEVGLLIGQGHGDPLRPLRPNAPRAKLTEFGWTIMAAPNHQQRGTTLSSDLARHS